MIVDLRFTWRARRMEWQKEGRQRVVIVPAQSDIRLSHLQRALEMSRRRGYRHER